MENNFKIAIVISFIVINLLTYNQTRKDIE